MKQSIPEYAGGNSSQGESQRPQKPQRGSRDRSQLAGMMEGKGEEESPKMKGLIQSGSFSLPLYNSIANK